MWFQYNIIESLHRSFQFKSELSCLFFAEWIWSFHIAHLGDPLLNVFQALIVCRQLRIILQSLLYISQWWQNFIDGCDVKGEHIHGLHKLGRDLKHTLCKISVEFLTLVIRGSIFYQCFGGCAMFEWVLLNESFESDKLRDRFWAQFVLMIEWAELSVIWLTLDLPCHVCEFQVFDSLDDWIKILFFFELDLLHWLEPRQRVNIFHCWFICLLL